MPQRRTDVPTAPPIELVAFVVRWNRGLRQWKTTTLADFARVSLSTIERIERGEKVSDEALDKIAQAFGYEAGYFTTPRLPLGAEEAAASLVETYSHLEIVPVGPMTTHRAVRDAARCNAVLIHRPEVPEAYDDDIAGLQECERTGQPVDLVDHDDVDLAATDMVQQLLEGWAVQGGAGQAAIVISRADQPPALVGLALDVGLAGLALGIQRVELEVEIMLGGFAGLDRTAKSFPGRGGIIGQPPPERCLV
jgi:transcriptional regulator with XRE-family HTH domain